MSRLWSLTFSGSSVRVRVRVRVRERERERTYSLVPRIFIRFRLSKLQFHNDWERTTA